MPEKLKTLTTPFGDLEVKLNNNKIVFECLKERKRINRLFDEDVYKISVDTSSFNVGDMISITIDNSCFMQYGSDEWGDMLSWNTGKKVIAMIGIDTDDSWENGEIARKTNRYYSYALSHFEKDGFHYKIADKSNDRMESTIVVYAIWTDTNDEYDVEEAIDIEFT